jgi:hypothetical protein
VTTATLHTLRTRKADASSTFDADDLQALQSTLARARALTLAVHASLQAQEDGSLDYADAGWHRWEPLLGRVAGHLAQVRTLLMEKSAAPGVDWSQALSLAQAFAGAAWWGQQQGPGQCLIDSHDAQLMALDLVAAIDDLAAACPAAGAELHSSVH